MLARIKPGVVSASFWLDFTFFTCMPAALTPTTLPLLTSAKTSVLPIVWILCLPFCLIFSPSRAFRFGACHGLTPEGLKAFRRVFPRPAGEDTAAGRAILHRGVVQIPDVLADPAYGVLDLAQTVNYRSILAVPMLRDGDPIGVIAVPRAQVAAHNATNGRFQRRRRSQADLR
jgi:GAF domain-containing protein